MSNFSKKIISGSKQEKEEYHHRIPHIRNTLGPQFHLKQRTLKF